MASAKIDSQLTIVIPTYNRPANLLRLCNFYINSNFQILILDGSVLRNSKIVQSEKFHYVHMPNSFLNERLAYSSDLVKTKYVAICADDDFLFPKGLQHSIKFLQENEEFAATQGSFIRFAIDPFFSWRPDYVHWKDVKIESNSAWERVINSKKSCQFLYSTMKREVYSSCAAVLKNIKSGSLTMNELVFNYIVPFEGKYRSLPVLYGARIEHAKSSVNLDFDIWIEQKNGFSNQFRENVSKIYSQKYSKIESEKLENEMTEHFVQMARRSRSVSFDSFKKQNSRFRKYRLIQFLRPFSSYERFSWIIYQKSSIFKLFLQIRNFKKYLFSEKVSYTPQL